MEGSLQPVWPFFFFLNVFLVEAGSEGKIKVEGGKDSRWVSGNRKGGREGERDKVNAGGREGRGGMEVAAGGRG